jgi:hypothetical protein
MVLPALVRQLSSRSWHSRIPVLNTYRCLHASPYNRAQSPTVLKDLKCLFQSPPPALALGLAGAIPFVSAPVYMLNCGFLLPDIVTCQLTYGAVILSFLGGVRWGLLVKGGDSPPPTWGQYSWSVTPSLVGWMSLLLPDPTLGCALCAAGLAAAAYLDMSQPYYPAWFRALRFILSTAAVLSLLATIYCILRLGVKRHASDYLQDLSTSQ